MRISGSFEFCFVLALALYLIVPVLAVQVGIGVDPTIVDVYLSNVNQQTYVPVKLSNPSDQNMIFTLSAKDDLKPYLNLACYQDYWCESREYPVAANTSKANAIIVKALFERNAGHDAVFESAIYVIGRSALSINGTVGITPRIMIRVTLHQSSVVATTTTVTVTTVPQITATTMPVLPDSNPTTTTTLKKVMVVPVSLATTTTATTTTTAITIPEVIQSSVIPVLPEIPVFTYIFIIAAIIVLGGAVYIARDRFILVLVLFAILFAPLAMADDVDINVTVGSTTTTTVTTTTTILPNLDPLFDMSKSFIVMVGALATVIYVAGLVMR